MKSALAIAHTARTCLEMAQGDFGPRPHERCRRLMAARERLRAKLDTIPADAPEQIADLKTKLAEAERDKDALLAMTQKLDEHPEGYDGPCLCQLCMSYVEPE